MQNKECIVQDLIHNQSFLRMVKGTATDDETTIQEFAGFVEQRSDVKVHVVDQKLADIKIDGRIYFKSLEGIGTVSFQDSKNSGLSIRGSRPPFISDIKLEISILNSN